MNFSVVIPCPNFNMTHLPPYNQEVYRWNLENFPSLIIESPISDPTGKCFQIKTKVGYGKTATGSKYPSKLVLQLQHPTVIPTHTLEWIVDTGKFAYFHQPCESFWVFSGVKGGWLLMIIKKIGEP